jgi:ABC-type Na+ efflux pump permease subunit
MTFAVHGLFSMGIWLIALGFYGYAPTAAEHLVLHPVANVTQMIPLAAGPYEVVLNKMYPLFPIAGHETFRPGYGLLIALGYRLISLLLGGIGVLYYLFGYRASGFRRFFR